MRAVRYHEHRPPDVLRDQEAPEPVLAPGEVLVPIRACALNHLDWWARRGLPNVRIRFTAGSAGKLEPARERGAAAVIHHDEQDISGKIKRLTNRRGVDVVIEHVGEATWPMSVHSRARGGAHLLCPPAEAGDRSRLPAGGGGRGVPLVGRSGAVREDRAGNAIER
jgi:NADPH:quinone reductase-like Zn-dependent oxidoreductase